MLSVHSFVFNDFQENTYVVWDQTLQCAIIDPGCMRPFEREQLTTFIASNKLEPTLLLNTHCHIDHILGNNFVSDLYKLPLHLHKDELFTYKDTARWSAMFGLPSFEPPEQQVYLKEGDIVQVGQTTLKVLFTPGHSIASISFYDEAGKQLLSGDVLFKGSIGRHDLPGGSFETLAGSIRTRLYTLPGQTIVYPGHGPTTTIEYERTYNQFVR